MPIYCYKCPECGWEVEVWRPTGGTEHRPGCQACGGLCDRDWQAEHGRPRKASCGEIVSVNAGVFPEQVHEANAALARAGLGDCYHDSQGNLHCPDRNRYLKALHFKGLANRDEIRGHHNG